MPSFLLFIYRKERSEMPLPENTYNSKSRPNNAKDRINDIRKIKSIINESNKILIPSPLHVILLHRLLLRLHLLSMVDSQFL